MPRHGGSARHARRGRDARLLRTMAAFGAFSVVEYAIWVTVLLFAYERGGVALAGVMSVAQLLPAALLAPPLGSFGDRLPRGTALSAAYAAEAATLAVLALLLHGGASAAFVVLAAAATTTAVSVARPFHYATLPQLAGTPKSLVTANSASGVLDGTGVFAGPVLAGLATQLTGAWLAAAVCAVAMLVAAVSTVRLRLPRPTEASDAGSVLGEAMAGVRMVAQDVPVFALLLLVGVSFLVTGSLEVLGVSFADAVLGGGGGAAGLLVGATGIGALVGAAAAAGLAFRARLAGPFTLGLLAAGVPLLAMATAAGLGLALVLLALCGLGQAFASVAGRTLLQRSTEDRLLARVFAVQEGVMLLGLAAGAAVAPLFVGWLDAAGAYLPLGVGLLLVAGATWPVLRRLDARAVFRPDVLAALRRVDFLAAMSPPALDRLSRAAEWQDAASGSVVIRQGDFGDAFYVVVEGRLSLAADGMLLPDELAAGDGFGEIALLHDVPRTATVTAVEPCRLLRVDRADFLAAITGEADGRQIADELASLRLERNQRAREG